MAPNLIEQTKLVMAGQRSRLVTCGSPAMLSMFWPHPNDLAKEAEDVVRGPISDMCFLHGGTVGLGGPVAVGRLLNEENC